MLSRVIFIAISFLTFATSICSQTSVVETSTDQATKSFDVIALGTSGGVNTHDLSSFLIFPHEQSAGVACDAGSLVSGIQEAIKYGSFDETIKPQSYPTDLTGYILREQIKGYLISHAHLDHVAGLIIASPEDVSKPIYGLPSVLMSLKRNYFNWQTWPNFADDGTKPSLGKYALMSLAQSQELAVEIKNTAMVVTALPLSHSGIESTAFVIKHKNNAVLCLGDTGPDSVENSTYLQQLWQFITPMVVKSQLKAIIIESSFLNDTPDNKLFGHLTPKHLNNTMQDLGKMVGGDHFIKNLPIIVSHIKPSFNPNNEIKALMAEQLNQDNQTGVRFIVPEQGQKWTF